MTSKRKKTKAVKSKPATTSIEGGDIVIRWPISGLADIVRGAVEGGHISPMKVTDAKVFARAVVEALCDEDEEGTTEVCRLFDKAFEAAIENGCEGAEPIEDEDEDDDD